MLYRKIERIVKEKLSASAEKVLVVTGARQVGKSYIIRYVASGVYRNLIEVNLIEDFEGPRLFENVRTTADFYLALSTFAGASMGTADDTIVFLDEIQQYPHLLTMLKFLRQEGRFRYVASGSLLGVTLRSTVSIPIGSIDIVQMYPLDFEEFLYASGFTFEAVDAMRSAFKEERSLDESIHTRVLDLFKRYLLVGGMPDAVNEYLASHNLLKVRGIQTDIHSLYGLDASRYDEAHRLRIKRIYDLIPSNLENVKKRLVFKDIENKKGGRATDYFEDIDYLIGSGIALEVKAISNPKFPLPESEVKNLLKLYLNDVGLLSNILYGTNAMAVLNDNKSVNLGSLYECAVAQELAACGNRLFYYDNKNMGEVDFLVDDYSSLSVLPVEVKSGKDYKRHSALSRFVSTPDYYVSKAYVLSNNREVERDGKIVYVPVYFAMFLNDNYFEKEILI